MSKRASSSIRLLVTAALAVSAAGPSLGQSIVTVVGGGFDDNRPAALSSLLGPYGVTVDAAGNTYVADSDHRIRRIDAASGLMTTVAGSGTSGFSGDGGPGTRAKLSFPVGLSCDRDGNVFVADQYNHRVRRIDAVSGVVTTVAGSGTAGYAGDGSAATLAQLYYPAGVAVDPRGVLFIADSANNVIRSVDLASGVISTVAGTGEAGDFGDDGPATQAELAYPNGVALAPNGDLVIADYNNSKVRRVERSTGRIRTVAGDGFYGFWGDGGPATDASFRYVSAVVVDASGNLFVADYYNLRIRKVDAATGIITTVAGTGDYGFSGDGGPATQAYLAYAEGLAVDRSGGVLYADRQSHRVRRVDTRTGVISTVTGGGGFGDGGPATSVRFHGMWGVAVDPSGNLYVSDTYNDRIRRVDGATGVITTIAGSGTSGYSGDGGQATQARFWFPAGLSLGSDGSLVVADATNGRVRRVSTTTGTIALVAGNGAYDSTGDGGPATLASLRFPSDVAVDAGGNVYVADPPSGVIRRVDARTGTISTFAGTGESGFDGDGGPASRATFNYPAGVGLDTAGNLYVADRDNNRIRRIDAATGIVTTVAGNGEAGGSGDGTPATLARLKKPRMVRLDARGNLFIADWTNNRVRVVDAVTGLIWAAAGSGSAGYSGDNGPQWLAQMSVPLSLAVSADGDLYAGDTGNGRVRAVYACQAIAAPTLLAPAQDATVSGSMPISWSPVHGAFRYDLYLGTSPAADALLASDVVWTTGVVTGMTPGRTYYWRVVAKGDPYCTPAATATSQIRSFRTAATCTAPPAPSLSSPSSGAADVPTATSLTWQAAAGAASYDVYLGTGVPPPLYKAGVTATSLPVSGLATGATYNWSVIARASCDPTQASSSEVRSFRVIGGCRNPGAFSQTSPPAGGSVASTTTLSWAASSDAVTYDVYLGTSAEPPLYRPGLTQTSVVVSDLAPGATYRWKVVARTSCDAGATAATTVRLFTVLAECKAPGAPTLHLPPTAGVGKGQTYSIVWDEAAGLDPGGAYVAERSTSQSFASLLDSQTVGGTSATFTATAEGRVYHRVKAVPACDPAKAGPYSAVVSVDVSPATPNVVFTVQPQGVVTALGERLEGITDVSFTLENVTDAPVTVSLGRSEYRSPPFFQIVDPLGGDPGLLVLAPHAPRRFDLRFSGPPIDKAGTYQGIVSVAAQGLAVLPYAYVSLKVGGGDTATPQVLVGGAETENAAFSPWKDGEPDASRPPLEVQIRNPGSTPMELTGEVGPELWLVPEPGWNSTAIPPGATRTVVMRTNRLYAPKGSRLPRYTYFKVRSRSGQTARLLIQDGDATATVAGRLADPDPRGRGSFVVPSVVSGRRSTGEVTFVSRLRLSNASTAPLQTSLTFTPSGADGLDAQAVRSVTLLVPPNDVLSLTDPLVQVFGLTPTVFGTLEVRVDPSQAGFVTVTSSVDAPARSGGGSYGFQMPIVRRGEGAIIGSPHVIAGLVSNAGFRTNLILAETTGVDEANVRATLYDTNGTRLGDRLVNVPRFGQAQINRVVEELGGASGLDGGRLELEVESKGGAVVGVITVVDNTNDDAVAHLGRPMNQTGSGALRRLTRPATWGTSTAATTAKLLVPSLVNGYPAFPGGEKPGTFQSQLVFTSGTAETATFNLEYVDEASGARLTRSVTVNPRATRVFANVLEELFGYPAGEKSFGTLWVEAPLNGIIQSKVYSKLEAGTLGDAFPVIPIPSEEMTGGQLVKPIMVDGIEQAVELTEGGFTERSRGTRTNLILNEVLGREVTIVVSLYEAANRTSPVATRELTLGPRQRIQLSTIFGELALFGDERRKDRTNVLCSVRSVRGDGLVAGVVTTVDNKTADIRTAKLTPAGGVPGTTGGIGVGR